MRRGWIVTVWLNKVKHMLNAMQFNILVVVTEHNEVHRMWVKRTKKFTTQRKCINNAITNTRSFTPSTSTTRQPSSTSGFCSLYCFCYWLALFVWVLWAHARIFNAYIFTFIGHVKSKTWFFVCLLLCGKCAVLCYSFSCFSAACSPWALIQAQRIYRY